MTRQRIAERNRSNFARVQNDMRSPTLVMLALLASACAAQNGVHPLTPQDLATGPYDATGETDLTGSLMYEGGCLLFRDDSGHSQFMPVWPNGSSFNGTEVFFHRPGKSDQQIVVGEEIALQGRPIDWATMPDARYSQFRMQCGSSPFAVSTVRPAN